MGVYVVNNFYTTPYLCEGLDGTSTVDQVDEVATWGLENTASIYFEFDSDEVWLTDAVLQKIEDEQKERADFLHFFVRGFEDVSFYGYGYDDQRNNPGYEEGVVLGLKESQNMDFEKASYIAEMFYDADSSSERAS